MSPLRPQERDFEGFRCHSDSGFQLGEHGLFGAKFESLDGAYRNERTDATLAIDLFLVYAGVPQPDGICLFDFKLLLLAVVS